VNFKIGEQYALILAVNPNNKIPAIVDREPPGGGAPVTIFESVGDPDLLAKERRLMRATPWRYDVMKWAIFQAVASPMFGQMAYFQTSRAEMPRHSTLQKRCAALQGLDRARRSRYLAGDY